MLHWSNNKDKDLQALVQRNIVNFQNTEPDYLFEATQTYFPDVTGEGQTGSNTATQCLHKKFRQIADEFDHNERRWLGEFRVLFLSLICGCCLIKTFSCVLLFRCQRRRRRRRSRPPRKPRQRRCTRSRRQWEQVDASEYTNMPKEKASPAPRTPGKTPPKKPESSGITSIEKGMGTMSVAAPIQL
jgi:hypothetical protein